MNFGTDSLLFVHIHIIPGKEGRQLLVSQKSIVPVVPSVTLPPICSIRVEKDSDTASATVCPGLTSRCVQGDKE